MTITKEKLKVIIIDDEQRSREMLRKLIEAYVENVKVVAVAADVLEGLSVIQLHQPDVIFLDIEMPNYSGFKLIEHFERIYPSENLSPEDMPDNRLPFDVVFTTAYEKYALKAYKVSALGYLMKPIDIDDLISIFNKIFKKQALKLSADNKVNPLTEIKSRLIFPTQNGLIYLFEEEIYYLESSNRYTAIYLTNGECLMTTLSLKDCRNKLMNSTFIRVHRSFIINLSHIQNYARGRDSFIILDNEKKVDVGLFYKDDLNKAIASFLR